MRIYTDYKEVISEIKRDLVEMGQPISTYSMQNKVIEWDSDYETKEITNYSFCLSNFDNIEDMINYPEFEKAEVNRIEKYFKDHSEEDYIKWFKSTYNVDIIGSVKENWIPILKKWLSEDFLERVQQNVNPGDAWKIRPWVWEEFIHDDWFHSYKTFDYTYSERIKLFDMLKEIQIHPTSRQYVFNIWDREDRFGVNGKRRIPCSLCYQILIRPNGELDDNWKPIMAVNMVYTMRSCDFLTHFPIDIIQAVNLLKYITEHLNNQENFKEYNTTKWHDTYAVWKLYYNCASLHLYKKDLVDDVF